MPHRGQTHALDGTGVLVGLLEVGRHEIAVTENYLAKNGWELDPRTALVFEVRPRVIFAMPEKQFLNGVTRWRFA